MPSTVAPAFLSRSQKSAPLAGKCGEKNTKFMDDPLPGDGAPQPRRRPSLAHLRRAGKSIRIGDNSRRIPARLPLTGRSCMRAGMNTRATTASRQTGFAGETVRALASTLLLLGLIGDRRVR
ncbi:hypothetical protein MesoLj113c_23220 [Mesorhizobium sp. 113-3-9]|nr:hypothetical protein MesoLj113c_23220 [Mesorhizobium sp. 113-3-9]